jgi:hypothetical protein
VDSALGTEYRSTGKQLTDLVAPIGDRKLYPRNRTTRSMCKTSSDDRLHI